MTRVAIDLHYRDGSNYKRAATHRLAGPLLAADVLRLQAAMVPEMGIVPSAVGLPDLSTDDGMRSDDDHPWHDVMAVRLESGEPDEGRTFAALVDACERTPWHEAAAAWEADTPLKGSDGGPEEAA